MKLGALRQQVPLTPQFDQHGRQTSDDFDEGSNARGPPLRSWLIGVIQLRRLYPGRFLKGEYGAPFKITKQPFKVACLLRTGVVDRGFTDRIFINDRLPGTKRSRSADRSDLGGRLSVFHCGETRASNDQHSQQ